MGEEFGFPVRVQFFELERNIGSVLEEGGVVRGSGSQDGEEEVDEEPGTGDRESSDDEGVKNGLEETPSSGDGDDVVERKGFFEELFGGDRDGGVRGSEVPEAIQPPFPFQSLVIVLSFIVPLSFVLQSLGSSLLVETQIGGAENLLVSPLSEVELLIGKSLPYFFGSLVIALAVVLVSGAGAFSLLYFLPVCLIYVSLTVYLSVLSRSYKELSFLTISGVVALSIYLFLPAIFTEVPAVSLISPLSLVIRSIEGDAVGFLDYLVSSLPLYLSSVSLFFLSSIAFRVELIGEGLSLREKLIFSLSSWLSTKWSVFLVVLVFVPVVFVFELLLAGALFLFGSGLVVPLLLLGVALVEEFVKFVPVYCFYVKEKVFGSYLFVLVILSGFGFFLGEKIVLLFNLVGLGDIYGGALFGSLSPFLFFVPLILHVATTATATFGLKYRNKYKKSILISFSSAVLIHLIYNLVVITWA